LIDPEQPIRQQISTRAANAAVPRDNASALPLAALVLGSVAIGASPIFVRLSELGPVSTAFHRTLWALPLLWLWARLARNRAGAGARARPAHAGRLMLCGLLFVGDLIFWHGSILRTTVANATLFANFAPLIVTLGAWVFLKERITRAFLAGMALALAGAGMLMGASIDLDPRYLVGDALGVITAIFFGGYVITVAALRAQLSAPEIMFWSSLVTCVGLLIATLIAGEALMPPSARGFAVVVALAWISQVAGQGLIAYALGHLPASFSSLVILIEPLTAAILGWIVVHEPLGLWQFLGGAAILCGIVVSRRGSSA
jgi:drug/metabolite transporter (DMT)-like permease